MFYFGDGELFGDDITKIEKILWPMDKNFCKMGICEVLPSTFSKMVHDLEGYIPDDISLIKISERKGNMVKNIKDLFSEKKPVRY
jgi:hypothetical protein